MRITLLPSLKVDFHSKLIKITYIHLYSIATKYFWNNALVEYIDNWSYSLVIIYQNCQKQYLTGQSLKNFITCRQFESKKSNVVMVFSLRFLHKMHLLYYMYDKFFQYLFRNLFNWERMDNFKKGLVAFKTRAPSLALVKRCLKYPQLPLYYMTLQCRQAYSKSILPWV